MNLLVEKAVKISDVIRAAPGTIRVISHYDADGVSSAAIMSAALFRNDKEFHLTLVKQLDEDIIKNLSKKPNKMIIFLDLGSGMLSDIQKHLLDQGKTVVVADHHEVQGEAHSPNMHHLNPVNFGIEENLSGSGATYLLARGLSAKNQDLAELAIIGAIGDSQIGSIGSDWGLLGLNKEILKDASNAGKIKVKKGLRIWGRESRPIHKALEYCMDPYIPGISNSESGAVHFLQELKIKLKDSDGKWRTLSDLSKKEKKKLASGIIKERIRSGEKNPDWIFGEIYELLEKKKHRDANEFATILNATGKMKKGYLGISLCLNDPDADDLVESVLKKYKRQIGKAMSWFHKHKKSIKNKENADYLIAGDSIGEHIISNVVSIIHNSDKEAKKPIFGFVDTEEGKIKVSARASDELVKSGLNLKDVVSQAAGSCGGEGGGHPGAAGATIPPESLEKFINYVEKQLKKPQNSDETNINTDIETNKIDYDRGKENQKREEIRKEREAKAKNRKKNKGKGLVRYIGS